LKHIFIINPSAGKNDSRQRIYTMAEALREKHGLDVQCMLTASVGHAATLARGLAESGEDVRLYACGGDGTVNEVANGIAGYANAAMTCIPIGTGNDFLKNFGADYEKFLDAENLWNGETQALDLIDCSGRYCLTIACSGIDARIAESVHKFSANPHLSGRGSYLVSVAANGIFGRIGRHWTVWLDEERIEDDFALVSMCNGRYYGGGSTPVPGGADERRRAAHGFGEEHQQAPLRAALPGLLRRKPRKAPEGRGALFHGEGRAHPLRRRRHRDLSGRRVLPFA